MSLVCSLWDNYDLGHKAYESQNWITNAQNFTDQGEVTNLCKHMSPVQCYIEAHEL